MEPKGEQRRPRRCRSWFLCRGRSRAEFADKLKAAKVASFNRAFEMLRLVLAPNAKELWNVHLLTPKHAQAVADLVVPELASTRPADRMPANARWAFLGGAPVLEAFARHVKQLRVEEQRCWRRSSAVALTPRPRR